MAVEAIATSGYKNMPNNSQQQALNTANALTGYGGGGGVQVGGFGQSDILDTVKRLPRDYDEAVKAIDKMRAVLNALHGKAAGNDEA